MVKTISHYRIIERLGAGGMGQVYKAEDQRLKRVVALKLLAPELTADEQAKELLVEEARAAAALNHPQIATVHELGQHDSQSFIVMEYVEGEALKSRIERGQLELNAALDLAIQAAEALKAAHARGLIHCDIKSSNIMVTPEGLVKVLDFGLAKLTSASRLSPPHERFITSQTAVAREKPSAPGIVRSGAVISGTLGYMSPEQVRGEPLDGRTDIFSLGAVLYEMLTARRPFDGEKRSGTFHAVLNEEPKPLSAFRDDMPLELESIIRRALAKERAQRYATAEELLFDLRVLRTRLEDAPALRDGFAGESSGAITEPTYHSVAGNLTSSLRGLAWRYRRWLLLGGALAAALAGWQILRPKPEGTEWAGAAGLLALAGVCALAYAIARRSESGPLGAMTGGAAFRGLLPFQEADRNRFYGRETDTAALFEMIRHSDFRFGVLFGESGSGKTSLLRAGLLPKLWEQGYVPLYCRSFKDPLASLLEECRKRSQLNEADGELPGQYLKRVASELASTLLIVCDQFEEFFVNHRLKEEREPFISFIAACHDDSRLPVKFLVSMRSDFLYLISSELGGRVGEPLISSRTYHLRNFDETQAREIIEKSSRGAGLPLEEGLSRQVARDLNNSGVVSPSELQIVGERLQSKRIYTVQAYRRAGGKEPLMHTFLEDVVQASGDRETCGLLLRSLISDENTRLTLTLDEIAKRTQRGRAPARRIVTLLVGARLVREIQDESPWRYELMHEYLIEKINQITGRVMDATQRANRLLRQYISNYSVDRATRIPISKLWFVRRYSDLARGERERELIRKSFRLGLAKTSALVILLGAAATAAAAALSISEEWESGRLSDGHTAAVRRAVFSPDGRLLVSGGEDKKVIVWDFARRQPLATFSDHETIITSVAFSPAGKWFATSSEDDVVIVWDAARLEKAFVLRGHATTTGGLAFSTDARFLISGGDEFITWRVGNFEKVVEVARPIGGALAFLPGSSKFNCNPTNDEITIVDAATGKVETHKISGLRQGEIEISPDGKTRVSVDGEGFVQFVDIERFKILKTFEAHKDNGRSVAFSPDGKLAASASENVILWDARTQTKIATLEHESLVWSVAFSPDGRWLLSTHADGAIVVWNVADRQRVANFNEHSAAVYGVAYSPDGKRIASSSEDTSVIIWNATTGKKETVLIGHKSKANGVAFLPDGKRVISCGFLDPLVLWDIERGEALRTFTSTNPDMKGSNGFAVSHDGRWLASSNEVYDVSDGRVVCFLPDKLKNDNHDDDFLSQYSQIYGIAFSKDGRLLAYSTVSTNHIGLLDTNNWELIAHAQQPGSSFVSLRFSPDGKLLATGDDEGKVELWSVSPLERLAILGRHQARVKAVAFSPDGKQVVSSSDDKTIALWNVGSRSLARRIGTHTAPVRSVAFSPDGKHIVSGEHDRSVRVHTRHRLLWGIRLD